MLTDYAREIMANRKLVILVAIIFGAIFFTRSLLKDNEYEASLTFMVNEDEGGRAGGSIAGLLGQIGINMGASGKYNLPKIMELSRSKRIIQAALLEKAVIDDKSDYIANHIIRLYDYHDKWKNSEELQGFLFTNSNPDEFSEKENSALNSIYSRIAGNPEKEIEGMFTNDYGLETSIMKFSIESNSETLSIKLVNEIYKKLSQFYIEKATEKQEQTFNLMKAKADSLLTVVNKRQKELLEFNDKYRSLPLQQFSMKRLQLERDVQVFSLAYGEALKNREIADFSLKNATPFFQIIDEPTHPIQGSFSVMGLVLSFIIGCLFGGFLTVIYILGRKVLKKVLA
jgi:uncharacterized protein involved in exopolysaccharide biosynthesis